MNDYISREAASADSDRNKIKTPFARIVVGGTPEKPCYNIWYFDPADGEYHIGFGSYSLDNVFNWLAEEFEVTESTTDVEPVRHGKWNIRAPRRSALCLVCSACGRKVDNIVTMINKADTVDAVPVVPCKGCEHAERYARIDGTAGYYCGHPQNTFVFGDRWDRVFKPVKKPDDFCSFGEPKEGGNENAAD